MILFGKKLKLTLNLIEELKSENSILKSEISTLRESIEYERAERTKLQDSILRRTGFLIKDEDNSSNPREFKPFGNGTVPWGKMKRDLEMASLKKAGPAAFSPINDVKIAKPLTEKEVEEINDIISKEEKDVS